MDSVVISADLKAAGVHPRLERRQEANATREMASAGAPFDRAAALKAFDETKAGVKGLVDSGITSVPSIFRHSNLHTSLPFSPHISIPTVDLSLPHFVAVDQVRAASQQWGFFQLVNHGIPASIVDGTISAVRSFHELPAESRSEYYSRGGGGGVSYFSNVDLFRSAAASWRDTLQLAMAPAPIYADRIPAVCRAEVLDWDARATEVARRLLALLCEGLGVAPKRLEEMGLLEGRVMVCHYYPRCPDPNQTVGIATHTDPSALTVLVQDHIGGLQVRGKGEDGVEAWVDVKPLPGALIINVGDLLQIISNDEYKSAEHRVVANAHQEARVSVAMFFNPGKRGESDFYGPLPELISPDKPALYRNFTISEFMKTFFSKELSTEHLVDHFKPMTDGK